MTTKSDAAYAQARQELGMSEDGPFADVFSKPWRIMFDKAWNARGEYESEKAKALVEALQSSRSIIAAYERMNGVSSDNWVLPTIDKALAQFNGG